MQYLHRLTATGLTIAAVIHQPRIEVFLGVDDVIFLGRGGRVAYYGSARDAVQYFTERGFPFEPTVNPADRILDVITKADESLYEAWSLQEQEQQQQQQQQQLFGYWVPPKEEEATDGGVGGGGGGLEGGRTSSAGSNSAGSSIYRSGGGYPSHQQQQEKKEQQQQQQQRRLSSMEGRRSLMMMPMGGMPLGR